MTTNNTTRISILIATRNRTNDLFKCIQSISEIDYSNYETIILDQSDDEASSIQIQSYIESINAHYKYIHSDIKGKSNALNTLLHVASGDLFALTDDDTLVPKNWLSNIASEFDKYSDVDIMLGQVQPIMQEDGSHKICIPGFQFKNFLRLPKGNVDGMGANMAMRSSLLLKVMFYDPLLGPGAPMPASEEGDFIYRAQLNNAIVMHNPNIKLMHFGGRTPEEWGALYYSYGCGDAGFAIKHLRCGDSRIIRRIIKNCSLMFRRYLIRCYKKTRHDELLYLRGVLHGIKLGFSFPINKIERLYLDKNAPS